ncbi:MAG: hypothetical protein HY074_12630 [Deltaproteobacteria bacterium]|nr:hypothetical protein [Deltaproteobacteria bacterium]
MRYWHLGLTILILAPSANARVGKQLVAGEVAYSCKSRVGDQHKDYVIMQDDSAIEEGRAAPDSVIIVMLQNKLGGISTGATIVKARLRKDPLDARYVDFVYDENPKLKAGEVLRVNVNKPTRSMLAFREMRGLADESMPRSYPLVCVAAKVSIHAKVKRRPAGSKPVHHHVESQALPQRTRGEKTGK